MSKRRSNAKLSVERHDRIKWWFTNGGLDHKIYVEKASGRAKGDGKELPPVTSIRASSTKQEMLKVKFDDYHTLCASICSKLKFIYYVV
jgi:hypothetical protein